MLYSGVLARGRIAGDGERNAARSPSTIRTLLVDDHALFRESVARVLGGRTRISTWNTAPAFARRSHSCSHSTFDLVLLDHDLGSERASQFLPAARQAGLKAGSCGDRLGQRYRGTAPDAAGRLRHLSQAGSAERTERRHPHRGAGGTWFDPSFAAIQRAEARPASAAAPVFNDRQRKVLRFVLEGLSNKEIAWRLQISESYVKAILQSLFQKTGVRTRGQLVRVAVRAVRRPALAALSFDRKIPLSWALPEVR